MVCRIASQTSLYFVLHEARVAHVRIGCKNLSLSMRCKYPSSALLDKTHKTPMSEEATTDRIDDSCCSSPRSADVDNTHRGAISQRFVILRERSSTPRVVVTAPSLHHRFLAAGVVVYGRTVVTSSYLDPESVGVDRLHRWVVEHIPLTPAAFVELAVVSLVDPEGFVETQVLSVSWADLNDDMRQKALYTHTFAHSHSAASMNVAVLQCAKCDPNDLVVKSGENGVFWLQRCDGELEEEGSSRSACSPAQVLVHNPWVLVGGGFRSASPPVACGPEWQRVWKVAAEPHDALTAYSVSARMTSTYLDAHYERYNSAAAGEASITANLSPTLSNRYDPVSSAMEFESCAEDSAPTSTTTIITPTHHAKVFDGAPPPPPAAAPRERGPHDARSDCEPLPERERPRSKALAFTTSDSDPAACAPRRGPPLITTKMTHHRWKCSFPAAIGTMCAQLGCCEEQDAAAVFELHGAAKAMLSLATKSESNTPGKRRGGYASVSSSVNPSRQVTPRQAAVRPTPRAVVAAAAVPLANVLTTGTAQKLAAKRKPWQK